MPLPLPLNVLCNKSYSSMYALTLPPSLSAYVQVQADARFDFSRFSVLSSQFALRGSRAGSRQFRERIGDLGRQKQLQGSRTPPTGAPSLP